MRIYQWRSNLLDCELSSSAKLLAFVLTEYCHKKNNCFPGITLLQQTSGLGSRNTVIKAIKELESKGLIKVDKKRVLNNSRESNIYTLNGVDSEPSTEPSSELSTEPSKSILEYTEPTKHTKPIKKINKKEKWLSKLKDDIYTQPIIDWLDYRTSLKDTKQWEYQLKALKKFSNPQEVVDHSIGTGYTGLYEPKQSKQKKTILEKNLEVIEEMRQRGEI